MKGKNYILIIGLFISSITFSQHNITIDASLDPTLNTITIQQEIVYKNHSTVPLKEIYLNDWANSFSSKTTPLGKRFSENYQASFHFEKNKKRGHSTIKSIENYQNSPLVWKRGKEVDIIHITLDKTLLPGETYTLKMEYSVVLPDDKFTRYGVNNNGDFKIRYWYLSPAVFNGEWQYYSNKDLNDSFLTPSTFDIHFQVPYYFTIVSDLKEISDTFTKDKRTYHFTGDNRMLVKLHLVKASDFENVLTDKVQVTSNHTHKKVTPQIKALIIDRVVQFLDKNLGSYPFDKLVISEIDYKRDPVYGLNLLPEFISPFPNGFEYDIEMLKIISRTYLENTLVVNPREDHWLIGAFQVYLMMEYVDTYYPDMKIIGNLSNLWLARLFHASELKINDQYSFLYLNMARNNLHQKITTPRDSLLKFNKNIASDYYGGKGLSYLSNYLGDDAVLKSIHQFFSENELKAISSNEFKKYLERNTDKSVDWFFKDFVDNRNTIEFVLKDVKKTKDSVQVTVVNKRPTSLPVSIYGINKNNIVFKQWLAPIDSSITVTLPIKDIRQIALNYESNIPEYNERNNFKKVKGFLNKPLQIRVFKDVEDPKYNQIFLMPEYSYNVYDGLALGPKLYNKTILRKEFQYKLEPLYAFRSNTVVGSASIHYKHMPEFGNLYFYRFGISGNYFSYDEGLFYKRLSPFATIGFRNSKDLRSNKRHFINLRNVTVDRDINPNKPLESPNYSVFDISYVYSNPNLINHYKAVVNYQLSSEFSKISTTLKYRKLFNNNRKIDIRIFAGAFLKNKTDVNDDFFSFALDRPTDYLFDYNYYGRSDDSGFFSQQLILAEGGFKSKLSPDFSNTWMATMNVSTNIWRWIQVYGDLGFVNNKNLGTETLYDSGLRLSLVEDYFEVFFPVYSNLGWEMGQANYEEKIRFIITIDISTLFGLFSRNWY
ncbi:MAG: metalloprotease [Flavobacterium sp.]|nr:MAG: metalloprotease [Flavobacterium sp.]